MSGHLADRSTEVVLADRDGAAGAAARGDRRAGDARCRRLSVRVAGDRRDDAAGEPIFLLSRSRRAHPEPRPRSARLAPPRRAGRRRRRPARRRAADAGRTGRRTRHRRDRSGSASWRATRRRRAMPISAISASAASTCSAHISLPASAGSSTSTPAELLTDCHRSGELIAAEAGAVDHMNEDHRDALGALRDPPSRHAGRRLADDRLRPRRLDLRAGDLRARLDFAEPVLSPGALRRTLVDLAAEARRRAVSDSDQK